MFLPTYYNATIQLDLLATRFIISFNNKLQIYLLFIWSRRVVVKTIFGRGKKLYVANECNNQRYQDSNLNLANLKITLQQNSFLPCYFYLPPLAPPNSPSWVTAGLTLEGDELSSYLPRMSTKAWPNPTPERLSMAPPSELHFTQQQRSTNHSRWKCEKRRLGPCGWVRETDY
jgi:hypothetical protein